MKHEHITILWISAVALGVIVILLNIFLNKTTMILTTIFAAIPTAVVLVFGIILEHSHSNKDKGDKK